MTILPLTQIITTPFNYKGAVVFFYHSSLHSSICSSIFQKTLIFNLTNSCFAFLCLRLSAKPTSYWRSQTLSSPISASNFLFFLRSQILLSEAGLSSSLCFFFLQVILDAQSQRVNSKVLGAKFSWRSQIPTVAPHGRRPTPKVWIPRSFDLKKKQRQKMYSRTLELAVYIR